MKISEVADRTGLTSSALRFYENVGIVAPDRSANGYRVYSDADVDALLFITRAKAVGLSLDEIAELVHLRDTDRCAPLQDRLTELVAIRLADTMARAAELTVFTNDLESLLRQLSLHQPDGPCDDDCGCLTAEAPVLATLTRRPVASPSSQELVAEVQNVCSLEQNELPKRLDDWQRLLAGCAITRDGTGATINLSTEVNLGTVADLVAAETECCSFFTFDIRVDATGTTLRVTAPSSHQAMIDLVVGPRESPA
jgi:DNA-binding transcriptional MerR regulator